VKRGKAVVLHNSDATGISQETAKCLPLAAAADSSHHNSMASRDTKQRSRRSLA
jgi:hypothetical protein